MKTNDNKFITPLSPNKTFRQRFAEFKSEKKYLILCFVIPALIMWLLYICFECYPFGQSSVLVLDLNGQYVYFFEGLRDILHGDGSLLYSFSRALGGEFIGIFAYYLSSPFSLLVALFPKENITEALLLIILLKTGSAGLTFGIYIEKTRKIRNRTATVLFSVMYALCGYAIVMQHNLMWFDNVLLFPLILLGIERLIAYGRYRLFVITLSMAIFTSFYIGYMTCIFCAFYFFYSYFSRDPEERNPLGEKLHFLKSFGRMLLFSAVSVGICAALIFGTYYSLKFGKTDFSHPNFNPVQRFDWLDGMTKLFIGSYDTVRPEGLPFMYSGTLTLILLPLYFFAPHVKTREKIASGLLIALFLFSFNTSTIDMFWHGLQKPNWLNYRYSYMLCFFMILFAYKAYEKLSEIGYRKAIVSCGAWALILLIIQKQDYEYINDFGTIWLSLGIIAVYLCLLRAATWNTEIIRSLATLILAILVGVETFGNGLMCMNALGEDVRYSSREGYRTFIDALRPSVDAVKEKDTSFYRMEKTHHRKTNDNFALGMNGLSNSTSTLNASTISLLHDFGLTSKSHWSEYNGGTPVLDTLFGIKYVITESDSEEIMELYEDTDWGDRDYTVWKNPYALSLAYGVSDKVEDLELHNTYSSPFDRMNALTTAMVGKEHGVYMFREANWSYTGCGDLTSTAVAGHTKYTAQSDSGYNRVTFTVEISCDDVLYMYLPSDYLRESYVYVNGLRQGGVFGNETDKIIEIGRFNKGDTVEVEIEPCEKEVYIKNDQRYFCYFNEEDFLEYMPELQSGGYNIEKFRDDYFEGTVTIEEGKELVFTSIPYDEGWNITLDGRKVDKIELIDGVIGFHAAPGEHTLTMKYWPECLSIGVIIQVFSLIVFITAWVFDWLFRKQRIAMGYKVYDGALPDEEITVPDAQAFPEEEPTEEPAQTDETEKAEETEKTEETKETSEPENTENEENL